MCYLTMWGDDDFGWFLGSVFFRRLGGGRERGVSLRGRRSLMRSSFRRGNVLPAGRLRIFGGRRSLVVPVNRVRIPLCLGGGLLFYLCRLFRFSASLEDTKVERRGAFSVSGRFQK